MFLCKFFSKASIFSKKKKPKTKKINQTQKLKKIEAKESIHITAGKQILLQSGTSHVKLTEKQITFGGESVIVGE